MLRKAHTGHSSQTLPRGCLAVGNLALGLFLLTLQLRGEVRRPLFRANDSLAQGRQLGSNLLLLSEPDCCRIAILGLLESKRLIGSFLRTACCFRIRCS